jgi:ferric-dicitrate binding protein FerR (iron transport regulator)
MNDDDSFERLLKDVGPGEGPDEATLARLREHTHAAWRDSLQRRHRSRLWAIAASVVLALAVALPLLRGPAPPVPVAQILGASGGVTLERGERGARALATDQIASGDVLVTGDRPVALRAAGEGSLALRVDAGSRVRWRDRGVAELLAGRIYVETAGTPPTAESGSAGAFTIVVGEARIRHLGTQYLVSRQGEDAHVLVREGRVRVDLGSGAAELVRGQTAAFAPGGGPIRSGSASPVGDEWRWAETLAPKLLLEGRDLATVLAELARETGRTLRFASEEVERQARETVLHGPALDPTAADTLVTLLSTTGFATAAGSDAATELVITLH